MSSPSPATRPVAPDQENAGNGAEKRVLSGRQIAVRRALALAVLAAAITAAVAALPGLRSVKSNLGSIEPGWIVVAVLLEVASCASFVPVFRAFFGRVPAKLARRVAWLEEGSGALLPGGGVTSYAIGGLFLEREGLTVTEIIVQSGGLFWLTSGVNVLALLVGTILLLTERHSGGLTAALLPLAIAGPLAIVIAVAPRAFARKAERHTWAANIVQGVADAWRVGTKPSWRLLGALGYLGFDMAVLICLFRGLGYSVPFGVLALGYLVGYCATLIPIPGGIGALDVGLTGALILYGTPPAKTAAAVLVYHAIAFWVPSLGGAIGYTSLLRHQPRSLQHPANLSSERAVLASAASRGNLRQALPAGAGAPSPSYPDASKSPSLSKR